MKKQIIKTRKLNTIYTRDRFNKKRKITFYIPLEWGEDKIELTKKIIKALSPKLVDEMTERNILTYSVTEYVNGNRVSHFDLMKKELKKAGL